VREGATLATGGFGGIAVAAESSLALEERRARTGGSRDLLRSATRQGGGTARGRSHRARAGPLPRAIGARRGPDLAGGRRARDGAIEAAYSST
jgi:propionate CoA-transferase